ncbi:hypothetical protein D7V94_22085 [Parablautia intestinalis]|uniref:Uncharacterized protein n=1 Tax=Parablautia intestinalis TaxID=2320100 RepID=A0A3A9AHL1_9FIRM|nr:hypothetical protein [Parablautia intestinalis]RKI86943.1 hypothetical protein D7V94_22085 [Parablautia intestinalis]
MVVTVATADFIRAYTAMNNLGLTFGKNGYRLSYFWKKLLAKNCKEKKSRLTGVYGLVKLEG